MALEQFQGCMFAGSQKVEEDDLAILYENPWSMHYVYVKAKETFQCSLGSFPQKDWIGKQFGSKVFSKNTGRWMYLLAPTPELWTMVLKHRTQILYIADISLVIMHLELKPGSVVLESGTGSASLTHSLIRAIAPTGHVHTFEFHPERAKEAEKEFSKHSVSKFVTVQQRNIEELGFPQELAGRADGVFLDLPGPWRVVQSAAKSLKPGGKFCSFSPCMEQVQRTCEMLSENGFADIIILECLLRQYEVSAEHLETELSGRPVLGKRGRGQQNAKPSKHQCASSELDSKPTDKDPPVPAPAREVVCTKPCQDAKGHTGYLIFACKFV